MNKWTTVLALVAVMVCGSFANADKAKTKGPHGKVTKIEKDSADAKITNITITSGHGDKAKETVLKIDDSTKITKADGTEAHAADLTVGINITATEGESGKCCSAIAINPPHTKKPK